MSTQAEIRKERFDMQGSATLASIDALGVLIDQAIADCTIEQFSQTAAVSEALPAIQGLGLNVRHRALSHDRRERILLVTPEQK